MAFLSSLHTPKPKSFSSQIYPLRIRQTQTPNSTTFYTTKSGESLFNNNAGISKRLLSSPVVRTAATLTSDGRKGVPPPAAAAAGKENERRVFWEKMVKCLEVDPGSPSGAVVVASTHLLSLFAPFYLTWDAFWVGFCLAVVTGLGVTLSYHRNLCHRSFKLPKWLEYLFAYCAVHALQGNPIGWVSTHRHHHQNCDSENDPHSPIQGFWYSHIGWLYDFKSTNQRSEKATNVGDLESQFFYRFIKLTYAIHPILLTALLYAIGGFPYVVWGMGVRAVVMFHTTFLVNSACHIWGNQAWNTGDLSRNNGLLALFTFGESWHNNHHAFEFSARHGLEWWQIDITWYVIWILKILGLATDVKLPTDAQKRKMAFSSN